MGQGRKILLLIIADICTDQLPWYRGYYAIEQREERKIKYDAIISML